MSDMNATTEAIQLAVAPVFLLTGVAGMLNALGTRLARVIDRARNLQTQLESLADTAELKRLKIEKELDTLELRGKIINAATALMVVCAVLIGLTVMELFYSAGLEGRLMLSRWVSLSFLGGFGFFITACLMFLAEILVASQSIRLGRQSRPRS
ncbi:MAG: DUF2721 domain-containing protein [Betaproteobacteria bacterium]|nr:DUF2721 domain-containing protein [Betaproteobacteria bacterium]NBY13447.1 DUF2721 domain-containing protein [Betaproteobacteria bacterium]